jgi:hypothetical protein
MNMADENASGSDPEVIQRLDTIVAILRLAHGDAIDHAKARLLADPVNAAILKATTGTRFVAAGDLKTRVAKATKQSEKTVQRRIQDLVDIGAVEVRPEGRPAYRASGLI